MNQEEKASEKKVEERKEKIKTWLKNPYNLIFIAIILLAFGLRLYYFSLTINQPLWWDEGEYGLKAKAFAFGTPETGWYGAREVVVPFIFSLILRIGGSEAIFRFMQVLVSFATVWMTYILGAKLFDKKIALIATAVMAVNAVHLFFTCRILTYLWAPLFFLLTFYLFFQGYIEKKGNKYLYATPIVAALGISTYGSLAFGILAIGIFLFITERFNFLKKKEIWYMAVIGFICLIPQFIYSKIAYGAFVGRLAGLESSKPASNFSLIFDYLKMMPHLFGVIFATLVLIGFIYILFTILISYDLVLKNQHKILKSYLLIILWAVAVLGFYTYVGVGWGVTYDAFVMSSFPALVLIAAVGLNLIYLIPFDKRVLAIIAVIIVLLGGYSQISYANGMIKDKLTSFDGVKYAGEWIKKNSVPGDIVISASLPQMTYYSERETYAPTTYNQTKTDPVMRTTEEEFDRFVNLKKPRFFTDAIYESYVPAWVHSYASKHNDTLVPVQAFFLDPQRTQVSMIVYEFRR